MKRVSFLFVVGLLSLSGIWKVSAQGILINEMLVSNQSVNLDVFGNYSDWIEIYNSGSSSVNLGGYFLTDDLIDPLKWQIPPGTSIPPGGFLLFIADGENTGLHTNFKLNKDGESVGLYGSAGSVIDTISFGFQAVDVSFGRSSANINQWIYFTSPTPGTQNGTAGISGVTPDPLFSIPGGFYSGNQQLELSASVADAEIFYTIDGTDPDESSSLFTLPISLDSTTSVRALVVKSGFLAGRIVTNTYFIDESFTLPVISLSTNPDNFFDDEIGIYVTGTNGISGACDPTIRNLNQDWERPVNVEMYETDGSQVINQAAGVKIFGGCSRTRFPQKSLALYARSEYGKGSFEYKLFPGKPIEKFETFILRSSADDQVYTLFRDALAQLLLIDNMDADYQAYNPAIVFLNGAYWGIHNIREKLNEHYFEENFGIDPADLNLLESNAHTIYGSNTDYRNLINFVLNNDMSNSANYEYVKARIDVNQFIDYQIGHIYFAERDWPGNNIKFWKTNSGPYSKWRWVNFDLDQSLLHMWADENMIEKATTQNGPGWPNPEWSTRLLRRLLLNTEFKNEFIQRYAWHINVTFNPQRIIKFVDSLSAALEPEIPKHISRWGGQLDPDFNEGWPIKPTFASLEEWQTNVDTMRVFANERAAYTIDNFLQFFGLSGTSEVTLKLDTTTAGKLKIVNRNVPDGFTGIFFNDVPIKINVSPNWGYHFSHWQTPDSIIYSNTDLELTLSSPITLTAYFGKDTTLQPVPVVMNEINYKSSPDFDSNDWVELYNNSDKIIDASGWSFKDSGINTPFKFPDNLLLNPDSYIVLCEDTAKFDSFYPEIKNRIGNFDFGLSGDGETITLSDSSGEIIDVVGFSNSSPWPENANGTGFTIELKDSSLDNNDGTNWTASANLHGSPGRINGIISDVPNSNSNPEGFSLEQNYPNPFNPTTKIRYTIPNVGASLMKPVRLAVYDVLGKEVTTLVNEEKPAGNYSVEFDASGLSSGIYFYQLRTAESTITKKMILLR